FRICSYEVQQHVTDILAQLRVLQVEDQRFAESVGFGGCRRNSRYWPEIGKEQLRVPDHSRGAKPFWLQELVQQPAGRLGKLGLPEQIEFIERALAFDHCRDFSRRAVALLFPQFQSACSNKCLRMR